MHVYGLVNRAVRDMVVNNHGEETWREIRTGASVDDDQFVSMQAYDDSITYDLVASATTVLGVPAKDILTAFGRYWVLFSAREGYGDLLDMWGDDLTTFLGNLDKMHARIGLSFPELRPPSFICSSADDGRLTVRYYSERAGLAPFVVGLIEGLAERFSEDVEIEQTGHKQQAGYDEFAIRWK